MLYFFFFFFFQAEDGIRDIGVTGVQTCALPISVSSISPTNAATGVALNSPVSATFSEAMTNATLSTASFTVTSSAGVAVPGMVNVSGNTTTFMPPAPLVAVTPHTTAIITAATHA